MTSPQNHHPGAGIEGERAPGGSTEADVDEDRALLELLGTRLGRLQAATHETTAIRRVLIAEMAQRDSAPLTCTASFVDVSELT